MLVATLAPSARNPVISHINSHLEHPIGQRKLPRRLIEPLDRTTWVVCITITYMVPTNHPKTLMHLYVLTVPRTHDRWT